MEEKVKQEELLLQSEAENQEEQENCDSFQFKLF